MAGYAKQRALWQDFPVTSTPILAANLNALETAIYELKHGTWTVQDPAESMTITAAASQSVSALRVADSVVGGTEQVWMAGQMWNPLVASGPRSTLSLTMTGRGIGLTGEGGAGLYVLMQDNGSVVNKTVTNAVNNGSGLIRITCTGHTFSTGDRIAVYAVVGATQANGSWTITVIDANTFDLQGSTFSSAYVSGGYATNRPYGIAVWANISTRLSRGVNSTGTTGSLTGTAANADDQNAFVATNGSGPSGFKVTDAFYVSAGGPTVGAAWDHGFSCDAKIGSAVFQFTSDLTGPSALAMVDLGTATASGGGLAVRLPSNLSIGSRNAANSADISMLKLNASDRLEFQTTMEFADAASIVLGTATGSKIGTATNQKLGFYNATPVIQPSATGETVGFTAGGGTTATDASTFTGNVGTKAYRISDIVKHLKNLGLIASS